MSENHANGQSNRHRIIRRRNFIRSAVAGATMIGGAGTVAGAPETGQGGGEDDKGGGNDDGAGFPPKGITDYGDAIELGNGEVQPFTTETPSGNPKYHGVEFERSALEELPSAKELGDAIDGETDKYNNKYGKSGKALEVHGKNSLEFFVSFPDAEETTFTFLGLNWNPKGHPGGGGAWEKSHFDVHFHTLETDVIDSIEGPKPAPYGEIPDDQIPEGYARSPPNAADERYITDMGEHLAPGDAPELPGNPDAFTNTLIQGFVGVGEDESALGETPRLAFVEPMITDEFLRNHSGTEQYAVPQPEAYPYDGTQHPTAYSVRDVPARNAVVVAIQEFEDV